MLMLTLRTKPCNLNLVSQAKSRVSIDTRKLRLSTGNAISRELTSLSLTQNNNRWMAIPTKINAWQYPPMMLMRLASGALSRKLSSLHDRSCPKTTPAFADKMFRLSSTMFTPPIVATSFMSSSSLQVHTSFSYSKQISTVGIDISPCFVLATE